MTEIEKLEKVKQIIEINFRFGDCSLYDCSNTIGNSMITLYD